MRRVHDLFPYLEHTGHSSWPPESVRMSLRILADDPLSGQRTTPPTAPAAPQSAPRARPPPVRQHHEFLAKIPPAGARLAGAASRSPPPTWAVMTSTHIPCHAKLDRVRCSLADSS